MISIIVPIFNKEEYLDRCLNSILKQEYSAFECILVDDGSFDKSSLICKKYIVKDSRFIYIYKENGGVSSARNLGISLAKGKYICFIDADDFIGEQYLMNLINTVNNNDDLVISISQKHKKFYLKKQMVIFELLCNLNKLYLYYVFNPPWGKLFIREKIKHNFFEDFFIGEDLLFILHYLQDNMNSTVTFCINEEYFYGSDNPNSLSSTINIDTIYQIYNLLKYINFKFLNIMEIKEVSIIGSNSLFNKLIQFYIYDSANFIQLWDFLFLLKQEKYISKFSIRFKLLFIFTGLFGKNGLKVYFNIISRIKKSTRG